MKVLQKTMLFVALMLASNQLMGQLDKQSCQEILSQIGVKSHLEAKIVAGPNQTFKLEPETVELVCKEKYLVIHNQPGMDMYIPYNKIKYIYAAQKSKTRYSMFIIELISD